MVSLRIKGLLVYKRRFVSSVSDLFFTIVGSSLLKVIFRSKADFSEGQPTGNEVRKKFCILFVLVFIFVTKDETIGANGHAYFRSGNGCSGQSRELY